MMQELPLFGPGSNAPLLDHCWDRCRRPSVNLDPQALISKVTRIIPNDLIAGAGRMMGDPATTTP